MTHWLLPLGVLCVSCGVGPPRGSISVCYVASDDVLVEWPEDRDEERLGVNPVTPGEAWSVDGGRPCGEQSVELVDEAGVHLWVAFDATLDGRSLADQQLLTRTHDAKLHVVQAGLGWRRDFARLAVANADSLLVELESVGIYAGNTIKTEGPVTIEGHAITAPQPMPCGALSSFALRFFDDQGAYEAANGESVSLSSRGAALTATNLHSQQQERSSNCTDQYPGLKTTWLIVAR